VNGGYWFVCPLCGNGRESDKIENYCEHGTDHVMMQMRGKIYTTTARLEDIGVLPQLPPSSEGK
jgi:hypothetical protein